MTLEQCPESDFMALYFYDLFLFCNSFTGTLVIK